MTAAAVTPLLPPAARTGAPRLIALTAQVVVVDVLIAGLLSMIKGVPLSGTMVYSQCIGLSIWVCIEVGRRLMMAGASGWPAGWRAVALMAAGCALGDVIGITFADALSGHSTWRASLRDPRQLLGEFGPTVAFCTLVSGWFYLRGQARSDRARAAAATHAATLARLDLLQSQLEPHMLFNTLANLRVLIATDADRATAMLDHLIAFLRATLAASRQPEHPLGDEFARLADYLALMQVRMGDRLRARTTLPLELATLAVPPLLLQPLVENAIKHGLEPQRGVGELHVSAALDGPVLVLRVADSGRGLEAAAAARERDAGPGGSGFGLVQVRERLRTLHGDAAGLTLKPRPEGGTLAEIRLPLRNHPPTT